MSDQITKNGGSSGLEENVASALSYVFGFVTGLIFLAIEKNNQTVRFHATQSIIVSVVLIVLSIVLSIVGIILAFVPYVGWAIATVLSLVVSLGSLAVIVILIVFAALNKRVEIPVISKLAEKYSKTLLA